MQFLFDSIFTVVPNGNHLLFEVLYLMGKWSFQWGHD